MHALEIAAGVSTLLVWLYLFFARGNFWRVSTLVAPSAASAIKPRVVAVIPARNEATAVAQSLTSLLQIPSLHIILVDDNSSDNTARIARQTADLVGAADRLSVVSGTPLPAGWSGKLWALHQGVQIARDLQPDYLLLTDADIVHAPAELGYLVRLAEGGAYDLASLMVRLSCETLAEKLLVPAFVYFFFKLYPPGFIRSPRHRTAGAAGGCILIRPSALERAGGFQSIRHEIIDDCALARAVKRSGGKVWLGLAGQTSSIRTYRSFAEIGRMISRTAFNQLQHSTLLLAGTIIGMLLTYVAPIVLLFTHNSVAASLGFAALVLMMATYVPLTRYYKLNLLWAFALPIAAIFYMGATVLSALKFWLGRGGEWKGRAQDFLHTR